MQQKSNLLIRSKTANTIVRLVMAVSVFTVCAPIHAETLCAYIQSTFGFLRESENSPTKACIEGTYDFYGTNKYVQFENYNYVCVSYSSAITDSLDHTYLQNCSVQTSTYKCDSNHYYSANGCYECSTGSAGSSGGMHTNKACNFCLNTYYYNGSLCTKCPDDGNNIITTNGPAYKPSIENCCLAYQTSNDGTGTFTLNDPSCCYK